MKLFGFSFIEMVVVVAILVTISVALTGAITYFYKSNREVIQSIGITNTARTSLSLITKNLREATYGDDGSYPIAEAATSTITFFANSDADTKIEKIRWHIHSNGTLYRRVTKSNNGSYEDQPEKILSLFASMQNASSTPLFRYYDAEGGELTDPVDVTRIASVQTTIVAGVSTTSPKKFTLSSFATLRTIAP